MDEFIQLIMKQLGVSAEEGKSATGSIMKMVKDQVGESLFSQISEKLPGVQGLMGASEKGAASGGGGGGLMGSLTSLAGSLLGDKAKGLAEITSVLSKAGLSLDKIPMFISALVTFLKSKLGNELFANVAAKLPELLGKSS